MLLSGYVSESISGGGEDSWEDLGGRGFDKKSSILHISQDSSSKMFFPTHVVRIFCLCKQQFTDWHGDKDRVLAKK